VLGRVYPYFSYGSGSYQPQPGETFDVGYVYSEGGAILSSSNRPTAVGAFQDRVMLSGTPDDPDTLYGSVIADYLNFAKADLSGRVLDSSGWEFTVLSNRRNRVQWLHDGVQLLIGTTDGIYTMSGGQRGQTITAQGVEVRKDVHTGALGIDPASIDTSVFYVDRSNRRLKRLYWDYESYSYSIADVSILADHLFKDGIKRLVATKMPDDYLWALTEDGEVLCMSYDGASQLHAWSRQDFGGRVVDIGAAYDSAIGQDRLYLLVMRQDTGGRWSMCFEVLQPFKGDNAGTVFVDAAVPCVTSSTTTRLDDFPSRYPRAQQIRVVRGTRDLGLHTMDSSFDVRLPEAVGPGSGQVWGGLDYTSRLKTLDLDVRTDEGSSQGRVRRLEKMTFRLNDTIGLKIKAPGAKAFQEVKLRYPSEPLGGLVPFTGEREKIPQSSPTRELNVEFLHDRPFNCEILNIIYSVRISYD